MGVCIFSRLTFDFYYQLQKLSLLTLSMLYAHFHPLLLLMLDPLTEFPLLYLFTKTTQ